ncbi:unnamed protein product [Lymnaea stagnalis]|uniref:ZP domain-containing protein n=1 Tax=Lymnaea stagnalis TaxID=6523 RepID=A0AAV2H5Z4_LYMST
MTLYNFFNHGIFLSIALLVFTKQGLTSSSLLDFNCLRSGSDCLSPSHCDITTGKCQCLYPSTTGPSTVDYTSNTTDLTVVNVTSFDYQCNAFTVNPTSCGPRSECSYHGNCSDELGACVCEEGYYGEECHLPRVQVACSPASMFINVNPHGHFRGFIYILHKKQEIDCNLNNTISRNVSSFVMDDYFDLEGWNLTLNHVDATCGNASLKKDPAMSDVHIYRREFLIQYSEDIETSLDQLVTAECRVSMDAANVSIGDISVQDVNKPFESIDVSDENTANVTLTVEHQAGSAPKDTTFNLGDEMDLIFRMQKSSHSTYADFKINKCAASNQDNRLQTVTVIDDECFDANIRALFLSDANHTPQISNHSATNSNPVIVLKLKAFLFSGHGTTGQVTFLCSVHFCEDKCPHVCSSL